MKTNNTVALTVTPGFASGTTAITCMSLCLTWLGACTPEYRISLADFLEQNAAREQAARDALPTGTFNLDSYLGPYKVGPGDVLSIGMTGADGVPLFPPALSRLDKDGNIDLPAVGKVSVLDRELFDVEDTILLAYIPAVYRDAACHVDLVSNETTDVVVLGAVSLPGIVQLRRSERNLLFAIIGAGGASTTASGSATLRRIRRPSEEITLNLRDPVEVQAAVALDPLEHGDIIMVHAAQPNNMYVGGLVVRSGTQMANPGTSINILQALAAAQGLVTEVYPSEGTLIRRLPDGTDAHVKLDLKRIQRGEDPNFMLAAGDILWVPETFGTRVIDFLNRNIFLRAGASANYNWSARDGNFSNNNIDDTFDPFGGLVPTATFVP